MDFAQQQQDMSPWGQIKIYGGAGARLGAGPQRQTLRWAKKFMEY